MKYGYYDIGKSIPTIEKFQSGAHILVVRNVVDYIDTAIFLENSGWEVRDCVKILLKDKTLQVGLLRKSFKGTVANNVLKNGCGGLNIDIARIGHNDPMITRKDFDSNTGEIFTRAKGDEAGPSPKGRFPANLLLDSSSAKVMDSQSGDTSSTRIGNSNNIIKKVGNNLFGGVEQKIASVSKDYRDSGGSSRFFFNFTSAEQMKEYLTNLIKV
jgi:hypothetical protein